MSWQPLLHDLSPAAVLADKVVSYETASRESVQLAAEMSREGPNCSKARAVTRDVGLIGGHAGPYVRHSDASRWLGRLESTTVAHGSLAPPIVLLSQ